MPATPGPIWVAICESFEEAPRVAVFSERESAIDWLDAQVERNETTAEFIDGKSREERLTWWFGSGAEDADDGSTMWGDGQFAGSVRPLVIDDEVPR